MDDGARFLARAERGAFEREPIPETLHKPEATVRVTAPLGDFLSELERGWLEAMFIRLVSKVVIQK